MRSMSRYNELQCFLAHSLINRNMPKPDNRGCGAGHPLGFGFHQDTCSISKHDPEYFTRLDNYVNLFHGTHLN
jgi:hypothetical protein